ncbi:hypothetical protein BJV77DRAFT_1151130 [Russula vinacea]|nr:hypothetical protein BJV77DRAFT_1151130 [Russula vinacea]
MSSLIFVGFFSLRAGHRVHTTVTKRSGDKASLYHNHYSTAIICRHPPYLPGEVRYYTRATDSVCADNSVAFMVAKGYIPAADVPGDILLDAMRLVPFPGDPSLDGYDDYLPEFFSPLIFGHGSVSASSKDLPNGQVSFPVSVAKCVLNKSSARWANVPVPTQGSVIYFVGACLQVTLSGLLSVEIENITFCSTVNTPSPTGDSPSQSGPSAPGPPPRKRRKYGAFAPPRVPLSNGVTPSQGAANENSPSGSTSKPADAPLSSEQDIEQHDVHEQLPDKDREGLCPTRRATPALPTETELPGPSASKRSLILFIVCFGRVTFLNVLLV